jgi:threonine dehydrogenase-like Zn-dependent dehydrogenase
MGADSCYDSQSPSLLNDLGGSVGKGGEADLVFELSGNPQALDTAVSLSRFNGRVVIGSWYGNKKAALDLGSFFHRGRVALISSQVSSLAPGLSGRWNISRRLHLASVMLKQVDLSDCITHRYELEDASQAYSLIDHSPGETLQVIFDYTKTP